MASQLVLVFLNLLGHAVDLLLNLLDLIQVGFFLLLGLFYIVVKLFFVIAQLIVTVSKVTVVFLHASKLIGDFLEVFDNLGVVGLKSHMGSLGLCDALLPSCPVLAQLLLLLK